MININISRTSKTEKVDKEKVDEEKRYEELKWKYQLVIKARNFHYENFNKWMTYFYLMISALVIGLCNILSKTDSDIFNKQKDIVLFLSFLGFIVSLAWHWSNKGYYYWNINFITLVNHYEKNLLKFKEDERVYFMFANKSEQNDYSSPISGANISTSKISILLSYVVTLFWGSLFTAVIFHDIFYCGEFGLIISLFCSPLLIYLVIYLLSLLSEKYLSSYHKHFPDLELNFPDWKK